MPRRLLLAIAAALVVAACSGVDDTATPDVAAAGSTSGSTTTQPARYGDAGEALTVPPQLADHDLDMVVVGDRVLLLAIADNPALRAQGLMGVEDLGDLDGMLFYWRHEASGGFWMKDTLIPLDIVWFNEDGTFADRASMEPCPPDLGDDCPLFRPAGNPDYRFAIESNPGDLDWIDDSTVIEYSD